MIGPARSINTGAAVEEGRENVLSRETPTPRGLQFNPLGVAASHTRGRPLLGDDFFLTPGRRHQPDFEHQSQLANHFSVSVAPPCKSGARRTPEELLLVATDISPLL